LDNLFGSPYSESSYNLKQASIGKYSLNDPTSWISPRSVYYLNLAVPNGPLVNKADTVPSQTQYYDG